MCGVAGCFFFEKSTINTPISDKVLENVISSIKHRGPDESGFIRAENCNSTLIHSRLAIRDLTSAGSQPMKSWDNRFTIVYNGEIYGESLRSFFSDSEWSKIKRGSDTRIIVEAFSRADPEKVIQSINGMFSVALLDTQEHRLILARDRFGEKPLFFHVDERRVVFSSELGALAEFDDFPLEVDREAAASFMRHNYVPHPRTILKNVSQVSPGCYVSFDKYHRSNLQTSYFSPLSTFINRQSEPFDSRVSDLYVTLSSAVQDRMISDVPIGCLLSGGIDSSLVAAIMQGLSGKAVDTFTIGFQDRNFDEAPFARRVAERLGTNHHELYVTEKDALDIVPELSNIFSEPFADSSQIPTVLVSRFARSKLAVVLTGDGGDELFAGYTRYSQLLSTESMKVKVFRALISNSQIEKISSALLGVFSENISRRVFGIHNLQSKGERYLQSLKSNTPINVYRAMVSHWQDPTKVINVAQEYAHPAWREGFAKGINDILDLARLTDIYTYLPDDILVKVDRASMSVGLETRAPFLDPRVFSIAAGLHTSVLMKDGQPKAPLKSLANKLIGEDIMVRKKMGFGVPLNEWLRGPLRDWVEDLFHLENKGDMFNENLVKSYWRRHLAGENWGYYIWNYLMLKDWLDRRTKIRV